MMGILFFIAIVFAYVVWDLAATAPPPPNPDPEKRKYRESWYAGKAFESDEDYFDIYGGR